MTGINMAATFHDRSVLAPTLSPANRLEAIEALRGLAAIMVVIGHILGDARHFGVEANTVPDWRIWNAGVDLFFVISGFIMVWTFGGRFGQQAAWRDFLARRLTRIVPLYWLVTLLTAGLLLIWPTLFDRSTFEWSHLFLSLLFIPHYGPTDELLPLVGVGWTLDYEMFFYLVFALGLLFPLGLGLVGLTMIGAFLTAKIFGDETALSSFLADSVILDFVLGMGLGELTRRFGLNRIMLAAVSASCLLAAIILMQAGMGLRVAKAGMPAVAVIAVALAVYPSATGAAGRCALILGGASYALYLFHPLVLNLTKAAFLQLSPWLDVLPITGFSIYATLALFASIATAILVRQYVELPLIQRCSRFRYRHVQPAAVAASG